MSARKVVTRSTHRVVGYHASVKTGALVPWESQLEKAYFQWLEIDGNVQYFASQPQTFRWPAFRYTPDALVRNTGGSFFAEVKPTDALDDPDVADRLSQIEFLMRKEGFGFRLVLSDEILSEPRRGNVIALMRYLRRPLDSELTSEIQAALRNGCRHLGAIASLLKIEIEALFPFIARGSLLTDLSQPISESSLIWASDLTAREK